MRFVPLWWLRKSFAPVQLLLYFRFELCSSRKRETKRTTAQLLLRFHFTVPKMAKSFWGGVCNATCCHPSTVNIARSAHDDSIEVSMYITLFFIAPTRKQQQGGKNAAAAPRSMAMDPAKCAAALTTFTQKMSATPIAHFEELAYGVHLYDMLAKVVPTFFTDASTKLQAEGLEGNWVLRKANLIALVTDMTAYARTALSASDEFDLFRLIDVTAAAKSSGSEDAAAGASELRSLAEMAFTMCVLSGNQDAIGVIRTLSKDDQMVLNQAAKRVMGLYALKPSKKGTAPTHPGGSSSTVATPTIASPAGRLPSSGLDLGSGALPIAGELSGLQHQVQQLRHELRERQAQVHELEGRVELAERERKDSQDRYRSLLESSEEERGAAQSEKVWALQLSKKDDNIRELSNAVQDMTTKNTSLKSKVESLEDALDAQRKAAQDAQQQLKQRTEERQDIQKQLDILKDRYDVTIHSKKELNEEVGALRNEIEVLKARQAVRGTQEEDDNNAGATPSRRNQQRRDDDASSTFEDETLFLKEKLSAAVAELRLLRQQQHRHDASSATPARGERSASRALDDEASPEAARMLLSSATGGVTDDSSLEATVVATEEQRDDANSRALAALNAEHERLGAQLTDAHNALSTRDVRIVELEKKAQSLEAHLLRSLQELEGVKKVTAKDVAADALAVNDAKRESDQLRKQYAELQTKLSDRAEATKKEQAILVSTVVQYGHRNLLLQQRQLLLGVAAGASDRTDAAKGAGVGSMASSVMQGWFMDAPARDATDISGSFLTKQRRTVERGLLDRFLVSSPSSSHHHK